MTFAIAFIPDQPERIVLPIRVPFVDHGVAQNLANLFGHSCAHRLAQVALNHPRSANAHVTTQLVRATKLSRPGVGVVRVTTFMPDNALAY